MKYFQYPISKTIGYSNCVAKDCGAMPCAAAAAATTSLKPIRNVHFPNDIVFQDYVRTGELERIGRFIRTRRVSLETIYHSGMAAIHEAVLSGNLACVKLLVEHGADIQQQDEEGWSPLHMACSDGFPDIARYLLLLGAHVNVENQDGDKPADLIDPDCKELAELFGVGGD
ncbi:protein phosphatase 1 regulatory subunit 27b [Clupea harengus]|uniref:Protein phosphatase 1 regulatory subunit 27b n=1 Tax=Clupea harengus TaxID=7950 RepID=A0A6P3VK48_CLUHA|nr:protein phosphatase 1 regulatory subunit 27b [Clupea harengus]